MKIAVFHNLPPGGAKRTLFEELKYLSKKNETELFELASTDESFLDVRNFCRKVNVFDFKLHSELPGFLARLEKDYQNFVVLANLHKEIAGKINCGSFDVALVHADKNTQAPFILNYLKTPSLYFCQEYLRLAYEPELAFTDNVPISNKIYEDVTRKIRKEIDRSSARCATRVLVNSDFTKRNVERAFGRKVETCRLGVDVERFRPVGKNRGNYILLIGEKNGMNGYTFAQEILSAVNKQSGLNLRILTLGALHKGMQITNDRLLARYYSEAIVTLCVSRNEPFGLAPLESMACQTPVVAVNEAGYQETVKDNLTGYLIARDVNTAAAKIFYLLNHPKTLELMGKNGRKYVMKDFGWERHNYLVENCLKKIVAY